MKQTSLSILGKRLTVVETKPSLEFGFTINKDAYITIVLSEVSKRLDNTKLPLLGSVARFRNGFLTRAIEGHVKHRGRGVPVVRCTFNRTVFREYWHGSSIGQGIWRQTGRKLVARPALVIGYNYVWT